MGGQPVATHECRVATSLEEPELQRQNMNLLLPQGGACLLHVDFNLSDFIASI